MTMFSIFKETSYPLSPRQAYLRTLFDVGDRICAALETWKFAFHEVSKFVGSDNHQYICLNALSAPKKSLKTVSKFRSFLIEFDKGTPDEQRQWVERMEVPYSTLVFSGNKSLHYIITLTRPLTEEQYDRACRQLKKLFENQLDPHCVNPQCFTRIPGGINQKTGNKQTLLELWGRIDTDLFLTWLEAFNLTVPEPFKATILSPKLPEGATPLGLEFLPFEVWDCMQHGYTSERCDSRHHTLISHMAILKSRGYTKTQIECYLYKPFVEANTDKTSEEFFSALNWVFNQED